MSSPALSYPPARRLEQIDYYHNTAVSDPYRWLEETDTAETQEWIKAQNQLTFDYLDQLPQREALKQRLTELWNYERYSVPFQRGDRYFYFKNDGLQNQSVLYTLKNLEDDPQVLLDPNKLSPDGTVSLRVMEPSPDGNLIAYSLSQSGSDWQTWFVRDANTGQDLDDRIEWVKFSSVSWHVDGSGFFYSRYDAPNSADLDSAEALQGINYFQKLYYHRLGTPQADDRLVYQRSDQKEWGFSGTVTDDGRYLVILVWQGTDPRNLVFYQDLETPNAEIVELVSKFEASYQFIDCEGSVLWFKTDQSAPRGRVVGINLQQPKPEHWQELIPETSDTLENVTLVGDRFIACYLKDAQASVSTFDLKGNLLTQIALPGVGSVSGFSGRRHDRQTFYGFTSFTTPFTIYRYDLDHDRSEIFRQPQVDFEPTDYETQQVFYTSLDGTRIPMFITHKRNLVRNGQNPTRLYGYGGFGVSLTPSFSVANLVWLEQGGVYAIPNLRGGGEYGETWHLAGTKLNKQRVFDDFIAAAEWLIAEKYTQPSQLAIAGGSNGGLLVGACMTQRPELFGATLPAVGVMDMLRFHHFTIGWAWTAEYGSPENLEEFAALYAYSPLHNLKPGTTYPATLITTADHDDRVVPAHSFKFAAALQAAQGGDRPILIRIETKAGHGAGKPTQKAIAEISDCWAFLLHNLTAS